VGGLSRNGAGWGGLGWVGLLSGCLLVSAACWVGKGLGDMGLAVPLTRYWKGRQIGRQAGRRCGGVDGWPLEESRAKGGFGPGLFLRV
jgi:hypothetical protein